MFKRFAEAFDRYVRERVNRAVLGALSPYESFYGSIVEFTQDCYRAPKGTLGRLRFDNHAPPNGLLRVTFGVSPTIHALVPEERLKILNTDEFLAEISAQRRQNGAAGEPGKPSPEAPIASPAAGEAGNGPDFARSLENPDPPNARLRAVAQAQPQPSGFLKAISNPEFEERINGPAPENLPLGHRFIPHFNSENKTCIFPGTGGSVCGEMRSEHLQVPELANFFCPKCLREYTSLPIGKPFRCYLCNEELAPLGRGGVCADPQCRGACGWPYTPDGQADTCPRCGSSDPKLHPALSGGGEVQPCPDPWHRHEWARSGTKVIGMTAKQINRIFEEARRSPNKGEPPCPSFSESAHDERECKHCGWTFDAHLEAEIAGLNDPQFQAGDSVELLDASSVAGPVIEGGVIGLFERNVDNTPFCYARFPARAQTGVAAGLATVRVFKRHLRKVPKYPGTTVPAYGPGFDYAEVDRQRREPNRAQTTHALYEEWLALPPMFKHGNALPASSRSAAIREELKARGYELRDGRWFSLNRPLSDVLGPPEPPERFKLGERVEVIQTEASGAPFVGPRLGEQGEIRDNPSDRSDGYRLFRLAGENSRDLFCIREDWLRRVPEGARFKNGDRVTLKNPDKDGPEAGFFQYRSVGEVVDAASERGGWVGVEFPIDGEERRTAALLEDQLQEAKPGASTTTETQDEPKKPEQPLSETAAAHDIPVSKEKREHTCIKDDGGNPGRRCYACEAEKEPGGDLNAALDRLEFSIEKLPNIEDVRREAREKAIADIVYALKRHSDVFDLGSNGIDSIRAALKEGLSADDEAIIDREWPLP